MHVKMGHKTIEKLGNISKFNGKLDYFFDRAFIANTEIIILLLFNIVPF
jgi:hypothetical protein